MKAYHIGIIKAGETIVIQVVNSVDELNCEIVKYYGKRLVTKKQIKDNKRLFLSELQKEPGFSRCKKITVW